MPALFMTPGPTRIFVRMRDNTAFYLGTCEESPEVDVLPAYVNVMNDIAGTQLPMNKVYDGEQHRVSMFLNNFDHAAYKTINRATVPGGVGPGVSVDGRLNRGSLVFGSMDYELIMVHQFGGTPVAPVQMPVGRRYYCCTTIAGKETKRGSRVLGALVVSEANGLYDQSSQSFSLYTEVAADVLNGLPPVTGN